MIIQQVGLPRTLSNFIPQGHFDFWPLQLKYLGGVFGYKRQWIQKHD